MFTPYYRPRRLRRNENIRRMVRETQLSVNDFIYPLFVVEGKQVKNPIPSMPGNFQLSIDLLVDEVKEVHRLGIPAIILFGIPAHKDQIGSEKELERKYMPNPPKNTAIASLCGELEMEISALDEGDREMFLREMGIKKPALAKVLRKSYDLLGIISFLTAAENESRAWPIPRGYSAFQAAAEIHSDIQRGFIKAETIHFTELIAAGDWTAARKAGKVRLEGKDYIIQDGDVILYRFNV